MLLENLLLRMVGYLNESNIFMNGLEIRVLIDIGLMVICLLKKFY